MVFAFPSGLNPEIFPLAWLVGEWEGEGQISYHEQVPTARAWNHIKFSHDGGTYLKYESTIYLIGDGEAALPGAVLPTEGMGSAEVQALVDKYSGNPVVEPGASAPSVETTAGAPGGADGESGMPDDVAPVAPPDAAAPSVETTADPGSVAPPDAAASPVETTVDPTSGQVWSSETGYWRVNPMPHPSGAGNEFYLDVFIVDAGGRMTFFNGEAKPAKVELASAKVVRAALAAEVDGSKRMYGYINDHLAWAEDLVAFGHDLGSYASFFLTRTVDGDGNPVAVEE